MLHFSSIFQEQLTPAKCVSIKLNLTQTKSDVVLSTLLKGADLSSI